MPPFINSLILSLGTATLACWIGCMTALAGVMLPADWNRRIGAVSIVVLALPHFLVASVWMDAWSHLEPLAKPLGADLYSLPGCIFMLGFTLWPIAHLLVDPSIRRIPSKLIEVEPHLTGFHFLRLLVVPKTIGSIRQAFFIVAALAFNQFTIPTLLQVKVLPAEMWIQFNSTLDYEGALLMAWPWLILPFLVRFFSRHPVIRTTQGAGDAHLAWLIRERIPKAVKLLLIPVCLSTLVLSMALPFTFLLLQTQTWEHLMPALTASGAVIRNSFFYASGAALFGTLAGVLLVDMVWVGWAWILFWLPGIFTGLALLKFFTLPEWRFIYPSVWIGILALTLRYLGPGWSGARWAKGEEPPDLDLSSKLLGADFSQRLFRLHGPMRAPHWIATAYVIYLLALWDVETLLLLYPPGAETLAVRAFNFLHYGHNPEIHALCLLSVCIGILPYFLFSTIRLARMLFERHRSAQSGRPSAKFPIHLFCAAIGLTLSGCGRVDEVKSPFSSRFFMSSLTIGRKGTGLGEFSKPRSLVVDHQDRLYVVDMTGRVQQFDSNGNFMDYWQMPELDQGRPKGMCTDHEGRIVVLEPHYSRINHFTTQGELVHQWGEFSMKPGGLTMPRDAVVDSLGILFLSEFGKVERVQSFDITSGKHLKTWGKLGNAPGEFNRAEGLGLDQKNNLLFVADSCNHRIQVFDREGDLKQMFGEAGSKPGQLSYPYDIAIDPAGRRFVCEFGNSRIQVFDEQNQVLETLGTHGTGPYELNNPWCIAFDSKNNLYIADSGNHRVQKWIANPKAFPSAENRSMTSIH